MIHLIKNTFFNESLLRQKLSDFILSNKNLSMGEKCKEFELKFAEWHDKKYAVLFNSGSSANFALLMALSNLGIIKKKSNIGFSALTWITNVSPIIQAGFNPIPLDINLFNLNLSLPNIEKQIKKYKLKCIFVTNAMGMACDLNKLSDICIKHNVLLLEDNCEAFGTFVIDKNNNFKLTGNFGFASTFSFYVSHNISCIEGGMVITDNKELNDMLVLLRAHGWGRNLDDDKKQSLRAKNNISDFYAKYTFYELAYNLRPTEITGFLGIEQMKIIDIIISKRQKLFYKIKKYLIGNYNIYDLDVKHLLVSGFCFPLLFTSKTICEKYKKIFESNGIEIRPIICGDITEQPVWKKYIKKRFYLPCAKIAHERGFYFGLYPELSKKDLQVIKKCLEV